MFGFKKKAAPQPEVKPQVERTDNGRYEYFDLTAMLDENGDCTQILASVRSRAGGMWVSGNFNSDRPATSAESTRAVRNMIMRGLRLLRLEQDRLHMPIEYVEIDDIREHEYLRRQLGLPEYDYARYLRDDTLEPGPRRTREGMMLMMPVFSDEDRMFRKSVWDHFGHTEDSVATYWQSL